MAKGKKAMKNKVANFCFMVVWLFGIIKFKVLIFAKLNYGVQFANIHFFSNKSYYFEQFFLWIQIFLGQECQEYKEWRRLRREWTGIQSWFEV